MRRLVLLILAGCGAAAPARAPIVSSAAPPARSPASARDPVAAFRDQLVRGAPTQDGFAQLEAKLSGLSSAERAAVAAIGDKAEDAIRVPEIRYEYVWVAKFACVTGEGQVGMQSLINHGKGQLDVLQFTCPGSSASREAFFDFSADPAEKAMKQELGLP